MKPAKRHPLPSVISFVVTDLDVISVYTTEYVYSHPRQTYKKYVVEKASFFIMAFERMLRVAHMARVVVRHVVVDTGNLARARRFLHTPTPTHSPRPGPQPRPLTAPLIQHVLQAPHIIVSLLSHLSLSPFVPTLSVPPTSHTPSSVWVIRKTKGRDGDCHDDIDSDIDSPIFYSVVYPDPDTGCTGRYIVAFSNEWDCVSSMPMKSAVRMSAENVSVDYLRKVTLTGGGIVVFDGDITYMDALLVLTPEDECRLEVRRELEYLVSLPHETI